MDNDHLAAERNPSGENHWPDCPEKLRLLAVYSGLGPDIFDDNSLSPRIAREIVQRMLKEHIEIHKC